MGSPTKSTIKHVSLASGNICAFPGCEERIFDNETLSLLRDVCHIKGKNTGSARYDENQSDKERHSFSNLIILCKNHHSVIDDENYSVEDLMLMKKNHIQDFRESRYR